MTMMKKTIYLDIETNMLHNIIWCCCVRDSKGSVMFTDNIGLQEVINSADEVVGHNIIGFDAPVLEKVWGVKIPANKQTDTLVLSRLAKADERRHSLEVWGEKLMFPKIDFHDYDGGLTEDMKEYCEQDVALTVKVHEILLRDLEKFSTRSIKLEHDVAFILKQQEVNGFRLDIEKCNDLFLVVSSEMVKITERLQLVFPPKCTPRLSTKQTQEFMGKTIPKFNKPKIQPFNVGSRQQIAERLALHGVKLTEKTEKGRLIINEKVLANLSTPETKLINRYLMLQKRAAQTESWLKAVSRDGRVHGRVITNGAITGRMTHMSPNMAQVPAVHVPFGKECRGCWTVDEGNVLVGADASGLELRMLAHYMDDDEYTNEVLSGDIHTANQKAAGLPTRDSAKTFIYAFLYGAGAGKIGEIVGGSYKKGNELIDKFLCNTPPLSDLRSRIMLKAATKDRTGKATLEGLDGRKLFIRSEHSSLNTLLQGAGAIVMKEALVLLDKALKEHKLPHKFVANVHDEWQLETPEWAGQAVGMQAVYAIREAGKTLGLNCPLDGEFKIGKTWTDTH